MINIVLADDHQVVRKGLKALLSVQADFHIVGESGDGLETLDVVERLNPDILVLDLMMPGINGLEVIRQLGKKKLKTRIVVLSMHSNEAYVLEAIRSGAQAYILKDSSPEDLVSGIREVMLGHSYLSAPLSEKSIEAYSHKTRTTAVDLYSRLTSREREILQLAAQGYTNDKIATRLYISPRTVETHRTNLMHKLDLHNQGQLTQFALQRGLIPKVLK
jgi:two-component system, NarL family, response regulator NreC